MVNWTPSNQPAGYDRARVALLEPVRAAVEQLGLPLIRFRKLNGILGALTMQVEDGGDSPEVDGLLLDALRAAIRFQVGEQAGAAAFQAIDAFVRAEAVRWELVRAGTPPPRVLTPGERIDELVHEGYDLREAREVAAACDRWLEAWEIAKQLARPGMRTAAALDQALGPHHRISDWALELSLELWSAGVDDPVYHEHRVRLTSEFLALFPDSEPNLVLNLMRAQGESLWALGRRAEAQAVYAALVERLPEEGWAYIGWSDEYYCQDLERPKEYDKAEAILRRALERPGLRDRADVLDRLEDLSRERGGPVKPTAVSAQRRGEGQGELPSRSTASPQAEATARIAPLVRPSRNEPCWCGSGKKYKHCHMKSDKGL